MSITLHSASVPIFVRILGQMKTWLDKAEAHAVARKFDSANYLGMRLAPDMLPFTSQVQIACDAAKFCVARLSGTDAPKFDDNEKSLADLGRRIDATLDYLRSVPADAIDGTEDKPISIKRRDETLTMPGETYFKHMALGNFFFHATTTYALLRHAGVELGKADFLGAGR